MNTVLRLCLLVVAVSLMVLGGAGDSALADDNSTRRVAVVVGANAAAPGRKPLRFAHRDADSMAKVLGELGRFAEDQIRLLHDPTPSAILEVIDRELAAAAKDGGETLFFFYYSGHADTTSLFPAGKRLRLKDLKKRLEDKRADVRIGVIDACRGGGWTGAKGLTEIEPFDVDLELGLASEGAALIASSSGMEDAHESARLRGSFFTHHFTVGLRGAADSDSDGLITLNEAFEYAKLHTVRDTALQTEVPQNPSFLYKLRGRRDLALSTVGASSTRLTLHQKQGPLQLIHLNSGSVVLEVPRGPVDMTLALPPGRYVVRRQAEGGLYAHEVHVRAGRATQVRENQLELISSARLGIKSAPGETDGEEVPRRDVAVANADEVMVGLLYLVPRYSISDPQFGPSTAELTSYLGTLSYLRRHTGYWATRIGVGAGKQDSPLSGELALHAAIGQVVNALGSRNRNLDVYAAAELAWQRSVFDDEEFSETPTQLIGSVGAGVRLFSLFAEAGIAYNMLPRGGGEKNDRLIKPRVGYRLEIGLRFTNTLF